MLLLLCLFRKELRTPLGDRAPETHSSGQCRCWPLLLLLLLLLLPLAVVVLLLLLLLLLPLLQLLAKLQLPAHYPQTQLQ